MRMMELLVDDISIHMLDYIESDIISLQTPDELLTKIPQPPI